VISKNTIISGVYAWQQWGQGLYVEPGGSRNFPGIIASGGDVIISDNYIQNCLLGIVACQGTIERNYIFNNTGVGLEIDHGTVIVRNNTIKNNDLGIKLANSLSATINYNNIQDSVHTSLYLENTPNNIDATNNWWGTGDTGVISASIQDFDDDFNLGKVNFEPILTAQNPHAMPDRNAPTPTLTPETPSNTSPSPSQNSTSTPNQLSNQGSTQVDLSGAVVAVLVVTTVVALLVAGTVFLRRRAR
jgi:hypothetical protein